MTTDTPPTDAAMKLDGSLIVPSKPLIQVCLQYRARLDVSLAAESSLRNQLAASQAEVERLKEALKSCWHAANTYDGNYTAACDNVATIAINALTTQ